MHKCCASPAKVHAFILHENKREPLLFVEMGTRGAMLNPVMRRLLLGIALALVLLSYFFFKERLGEFGITAANRVVQDAVKPGRGMLSDIKKWQRESQIRRIVGLVFYGRRSQASILDCYLKVSRYATSFSFPLVSIKSRSVKSRIRAVIGIRR